MFGSASNDTLTIIRGREQILDQGRTLHDLSLRSDQPSAFHDLEFKFSHPGFRTRRPTLILFQNPAENLATAAVLLYEYRLLGVGTGIYGADFLDGANAVVAPRENRHCAALAACEAMIQDGARLVHLSFEGEHLAHSFDGDPQSRARWAMRTRCTAHYLNVYSDAEETLNQLGRRTRRNLRYYRRAVESELGAELVVDPSLTLDEYLHFHDRCDYPVSHSCAAARFDKLRSVPRPLLLGLRAANGELLSLLGGHYKGPDVCVEWQLNRSDMHQYSLCTAMRAFLLEYASTQPLRRISFIGGTNHSTGNALTPETIVDLVATRGPLPQSVVQHVASAFEDLPAYQGTIPELTRQAPGPVAVSWVPEFFRP